MCIDLTKVTIRDLNQNEFLREDFVKPFIQYVTRIPNPANSVVKVAEIDGKIIGFIAVQPYYFVEPLWIDEEYRGSFLWKKLFNSLINAVKKDGLSLFILHQNPKLSKLMNKFHFHELPNKLARRIL